MLRVSFIAIFIAVFISGCDYRLKQNPDGGNVLISSERENLFSQAFAQILNQQATARYRVVIAAENKRERVVTYDSNGHGRDINLALSIGVKIYDLTGQLLLADELKQAQMVALSGDAQTDNVQKQDTYQDLRNNLVYLLSVRLNSLDERQK